MHKRPTRFIICLFDIIALVMALMISGIVARYISHDILGNSYINIFSIESLERVYYFSIISACVLFTFYNRGHYLRRIPFWSQVRYILITLLAAMLVDGFMHFATKYPFSRLWIVMSWIFAFMFITAARSLARIVALRLGIWTIPTIIIGDSDNIIETLFALESEKQTGYDMQILFIKKGYTGFDTNILPASYKNVKIERYNADMADFITKHRESFYIIAPNSFESFDAEKIIDTISAEKADYALVPAIEGVKLYGTNPQYFFGHDVMFLVGKNRINSPIGKAIKRSIDILGSIFGLIILSPFFFFAWVMIKNENGALFFGNELVGKSGNKFVCWKFKTMSENTVTKAGGILRGASLDELPQLWNVLKGEMSLVGPRPIAESEKNNYGDKINDYLSVKPGITGLWQISGRDNAQYKHRVYLDSWYVQNWSLWHDIVILLKTVFVLIRNKTNA